MTYDISQTVEIADNGILDNAYVLAILCMFFIINLLLVRKDLMKIKFPIICFVFGIILYLFGYLIIMNEISNGIEYHYWKYLISKICNILSIIIQLIPFIICLKNNRKSKKDEVKQNV